MTNTTLIRSVCQGLACSAGVATGAYAAYAGSTWLRYGRVRPAVGDEQDSLLDAFIPAYEIAERHQISVAAPAAIAFGAACEVDFQRSGPIRAIFKGRELVMGSAADSSDRPRGLLALARSIGWGVLAEIPGREVVVGAVTQPWKADVFFRSVPAAAFASFNEPDHVKIVWTLRADPAGDGASIVRTETRVSTTDADARRKFRRYWSLASPGIVLIRRLALSLVKTDAERRARETRRSTGDRFNLVSTGDLDPQC
jgi:hypothetical protein